MSPLDVVFLGPVGNTHVASSLYRAAHRLGIASRLKDTAFAFAGPYVLRKLSWHLGDRKPYRLGAFANGVLRDLLARPCRTLITIGQAPLTAPVLEGLRKRGLRCVNFSTDDPFNPVHRSRWQLRTLPVYDIVFTPRRANIEDLRTLGCKDVRYLPFGYDEDLFDPSASAPQGTQVPNLDVLFVGGADRDRAAFFDAYIQSGLKPTFVGGYWSHYRHTRSASLGLLQADEIRRLTAAAAVNLCLVRRANRDGHVMRSFEIPASGGFMITEDTEEHRELFGDEGERTLFFRTPEEAAEKSRWALAHPAERQRMARALREHIKLGRHSYRDRLQTMLEAVLI